MNVERLVGGGRRRVGRPAGLALGPFRQARWNNTRRGLSLLEMSIAMALLAIVLTGMAMGFGASFKAVNGAKRVTGGSKFLESVMQNVGAQPYDNLLAMNGNQFFDQTTLGDSNFTVDLVVFQTEVELLQVEATLTDTLTTRELATITTLRSQR